jgi:hypothetical protein
MVENGPKKCDDHSESLKSTRKISFVKLGGKGSWFVKWDDGSTASQGLPPQLHAKLHNRSKKLPRILSLSISSESDWFVVFNDGSFSRSMFRMSEKLENALAESEPALLVFAPFGGWVLIRNDYSIIWERLPTGLEELLTRKTAESSQPFVKHITINAVGGWFARFLNEEYAFGGIPIELEQSLSSLSPKKFGNLLVELSTAEENHYFLQSGNTVESVTGTQDLGTVLEYAQRKSTVIPENCIFEPGVQSPEPSRSNTPELLQ